MGWYLFLVYSLRFPAPRNTAILMLRESRLGSVIAAVRNFRKQRVLVVGDAMLDCYLLGTATRISPEGPVPVVRSVGRQYLPGGAANTAVNAGGLGATVSLLAVVGADHEADLLREILSARAVDPSTLIVDPSRPTTTKIRILADDHFLARFDEERDEEVTGPVADSLLDAFRKLFKESDVVIVSDYMKGVVMPRLVSEIGRLNRDQSRLVVVDSKDLSRHRFRNVSVITPNHLEAQRAVNISLSRDIGGNSEAAFEAVGRTLLDQVGTKWAMVTIGAGGALLFERERPVVRVRTRDVRNPEVVGAGDSLTAALALALASGLPITDSAQVAVEAAGIAVAKPFTASVEQHELLQRLSRRDGLDRFEDVALRLEDYRRRGKRIVLTNGVFDGLHSGHIAFLRAARRLGDVLVVGVNSDRSIRRRSGRSPLLPQEERLSVVAALEPVDHAVLFDEETPVALIRRVRPNVHVKGGDYEGEHLPEESAVREVGAELAIIPLQEPVGGLVAAVGPGSPHVHRPALTVIRGGESRISRVPGDASDLPEEAVGS